jgi:hypothetical protein
VNIPITSILIPTIFRTFDVKSGHFPHLASPEREYPGRHSAHRVPVYPSVQLPFGSDKLLGGIKPSDSKTKALDTFIWNPAKLLNGFYLGFLFTIKKNLINEIQQEIQWKWEDFKNNGRGPQLQQNSKMII